MMLYLFKIYRIRNDETPHTSRLNKIFTKGITDKNFYYYLNKTVNISI